jgi:hypothetical protein
MSDLQDHIRCVPDKVTGRKQHSTIKKGAVALSEGLILRGCGKPLQNCIEIAGFTQILPFAAEGTADPKLAVRSDDRPARTCWAFGLQELQPSFPPPLGQDQVHPGRLFKAVFPGLAAPVRT